MLWIQLFKHKRIVFVLLPQMNIQVTQNLNGFHLQKEPCIFDHELPRSIKFFICI